MFYFLILLRTTREKFSERCKQSCLVLKTSPICSDAYGGSSTAVRVPSLRARARALHFSNSHDADLFCSSRRVQIQKNDSKAACLSWLRNEPEESSNLERVGYPYALYTGTPQLSGTQFLQRAGEAVVGDERSSCKM